MCTHYYINFCLGAVSFSLLCETKLITIKINSFQKPRIKDQITETEFFPAHGHLSRNL